MQVIQSVIYGIARAKLTLYEQRILIKIVEHAQAFLRGVRIEDHLEKMEHSFDNVRIVVPAAYVLNEGSHHYEEVRDALRSLMSRTFEFFDSDTETWFASPLIYNVTYFKGRGSVQFYVSRVFFDVLLDFSKGFCTYDLEAALSLRSPYSVRWYALTCSMGRPLPWSIDAIRKMFGLADEYKQPRDLIKRCVEPAAKELEQRGLNGFSYKVVKEGGRIKGVLLSPVKRQTDEVGERKAREAAAEALPKDILLILMRYCHFTYKEVSAHKPLLRKFARIPDAMGRLYRIEARYRTGKKQKGYVINALKGEVFQFEQRLKDLRHV